MIPVYKGSSDLLPVVLEETGGLGVDIVIDSGGKDTLGNVDCCDSFRAHNKSKLTEAPLLCPHV